MSRYNKLPVSASIIELLNLDKNIKLTRAEVSDKIYNYIIQKDLYEENSDKINPNEALIKALKLKSHDELTFSTFQLVISRLYKEMKKSSHNKSDSSDSEIERKVVGNRKNIKYSDTSDSETESKVTKNKKDNDIKVNSTNVNNLLLKFNIKNVLQPIPPYFINNQQKKQILNEYTNAHYAINDLNNKNLKLKEIMWSRIIELYKLDSDSYTNATINGTDNDLLMKNGIFLPNVPHSLDNETYDILFHKHIVIYRNLLKKIKECDKIKEYLSPHNLKQ